MFVDGFSVVIDNEKEVKGKQRPKTEVNLDMAVISDSFNNNR